MDRGALLGRNLKYLPQGDPQQALGLLSMVAPPVAGDVIGLLEDAYGYASGQEKLTPAAGLLSLAGLVPGIPSVSQAKRVIRPRGWDAAADGVDELSRSGHLYRGMTKQEFEATVGAGSGVRSSGAFSASGEGTNFADKFSDAESYVNFGRTDPRKTGEPTYVVEILGDGIRRSKDGYYKASEVGGDRITRVWEMIDEAGEVIARRIR